MSPDLFFVARKVDFADARAAGFFASDAQLRARRKLLKAIAAHFDGAAIGGKAADGMIHGSRAANSLRIRVTRHGTGAPCRITRTAGYQGCASLSALWLPLA
jgi:hypothetical protein